MAFNFVPAGTILPFGGATAPSGWLLCDGSSVSQSSYPALYAAIGVLWGNPGGGSFNLPDGRGAFFRGAGTSGVHVGPATVGSVQSQATAKNGLGATGGTASLTGSTTFPSTSHAHVLNDYGYAQANVVEAGGNAIADFRRTTGPVTTYSSNIRMAVTAGGGYSGHNTGIALSGRTDNASTDTTSVGISSTAAGLNAGDSETRPNSKGVNYIIKI